MNSMTIFLSPGAALLFSPLLMGIINRTKAVFAGRKGQPLLQVYYDLFRLFQKGMVLSTTTSWIFRAAPFIVFIATLAATCFIPIITTQAGPSFPGDVILLLYFLGLARFFLILSSLDTGSAFEGMGASRETFYSALAEPVLLICLLFVMREKATDSVFSALAYPTIENPVLVFFVAIPLFIVLLAENSRIPFDDPTTHLELTMIHEVMILDNSGPGLGLMEYAASLKLWLFTLIIARILVPSFARDSGTNVLVLTGLILLIGIAIGIVESTLARLRLTKVPHILFGAGVLAMLGFFFSLSGVLQW